MRLPTLLTLDQIKDAARRLEGVVHRTPVDYSRTFSRLTCSEVFFKLENLQKTGSFKIRGAYNKIASLTPAEREAGVVAASAGNHAQGVAFAAACVGIQATVVMPENTPVAKVAATRGYGAGVVLAGKNYDEAYERALALQRETGAVLIHAFDDPLVAAGQGTVGLELLADVPGLEAVLVPVGGGGLLAGISVAVKTLDSSIKVIGVQAAGVPAVYNAFKKGERTVTGTIADGIGVRRPGEFTLDIIRRYVDDVVVVEEEEIARAILLLLERSKTLVEGAGAVVLAALLGRHFSYPGAKLGLVLSGGNIDLNLLPTIIERGLIRAGRITRLRTVIHDEPGSLRHILGVVAATRANVISVSHDRVKPRVPLKQAEVELLLETTDAEHAAWVITALKNAGYRVERIT
ncbi:MAG: threonine ammonia-lyase [Bacillota bacterium]